MMCLEEDVLVVVLSNGQMNSLGNRLAWGTGW